MSARPAGTATADAHPTNDQGRVGLYRSILAWSMLVAGAVILLATVWVGWRAFQAYRDLQAAAGQVTALQQQLTDPALLGPTSEQRDVLSRFQADASAARSAVDDPIFRLATGVPFVGPNLDAIREISLTVDELATEVAPALGQVAQTLDPARLAPPDGAVDLAPIAAVAPQLEMADGALANAQDRMADLDPSTVIAPIGDAVAALRAKLGSAADIIGPAARAARLLPDVLGADGPRTYLAVFQNLAEPRATGGIFGSYAIVSADNGRVSIIDQGPARSLQSFDPPVGQLTDEQRRLYGSEFAAFPADVNLTPDFPSAAQLFIDMYRTRTGAGAVDGVLAIDPVTLSYLLEGAPALDVDGIEIDSTNVVSTLLSHAYQHFDDADHDPRDQFLAQATSAAFAQVMSGAADPASVVSGLRKAADERRLLFYSTHSDEQADIADTGLSGALDGPTEASGIGVFLNDAVGSKLGYYLGGQAAVSGGECLADGSQTATVTVTLTYQPPASGLPAYVVGTSADYSYRTHVLVVAPTDGRIDAAELGDQPVSFRPGTDGGRPVGSTVVELKPGTETALTFHLTIPPGQPAPTLVHTPTVSAWPVSVQGFATCRG